MVNVACCFFSSYYGAEWSDSNQIVLSSSVSCQIPVTASWSKTYLVNCFSVHFLPTFGDVFFVWNIPSDEFWNLNQGHLGHGFLMDTLQAAGILVS